MRLFIFIYFIFCTLNLPNFSESSSCSIDPTSQKEYPKNPPLILNSKEEWKLTNGTQKVKEIHFNNNETVYFECTSDKYFSSIGKGVSGLNATCIGKNVFSVKIKDKYKNMKFNRLGCNGRIKAELGDKGACGRRNEFSLYEIGFKLSIGFKPLIKICFEPEHSRTVWSRHLIPFEVDTTLSNKRPKFKKDRIFKFDALNSYKRKTQKLTFTKLLGSEALAEKYINDDNYHFLARGHLSAKSDFIFPQWQDATFRLSNAAPQWQLLNSRNWGSLEQAIQNRATELDTDLIVYTGTHEVLTLQNIDGVPVEIFLHPVDGNHIPVPKLFWKAVYDPVKRDGIVFLGVNNVYIDKKELEEYLICDPVDSHPILNEVPNAQNVEMGYVYACEIKEVEKILVGFPIELSMNRL